MPRVELLFCVLLEVGRVGKKQWAFSIRGSPGLHLKDQGPLRQKLSIFVRRPGVLSSANSASMVARFALGSTLSVFPDEVDRPVYQVVAEVPHLRADIDRILGKEYARVKTLLEAERDTVIALSRALKKERRLEGERLSSHAFALIRQTLLRSLKSFSTQHPVITSTNERC